MKLRRRGSEGARRHRYLVAIPLFQQRELPAIFLFPLVAFVARHKAELVVERARGRLDRRFAKRVQIHLSSYATTRLVRSAKAILPGPMGEGKGGNGAAPPHALGPGRAAATDEEDEHDRAGRGG